MTTLRDDPIFRAEQQRRSAALVSFALAQRVGGDPEMVVDAFKRSGHGDAFGHIIKAAVAVGTTTDWAVSPALAPLREALITEADYASILGPLVAAGALQVPVGGAGRFQLQAVTAGTVAEAGIKPFATLAFTVDPMTPTKAAVMIAFSAEAARSADATMQRAITTALVSALSAQIDGTILAQWTSTSGASLGAAAVSATTIGTLLHAISDGHPVAPVIIGSLADVAALAPAIADLERLGVRFVPCAAANGTLIALDAAGVLVADSGGQVQLAREATVTMDDGDGRGDPVSLWTSNLVALKAERWFALALRADAMRYVTVTAGSV